MELPQHLLPKFGLRQHALDSFDQNALWVLVQNVLVILLHQTTRVASVVGVSLFSSFVAGNRNSFAVDDYNRVAAKSVLGECWLVLAHQNHGNITGQSTKNFILGVGLKPARLDFGRLKVGCFRSHQN